MSWKPPTAKVLTTCFDELFTLLASENGDRAGQTQQSPSLAFEVISAFRAWRKRPKVADKIAPDTPSPLKLGGTMLSAADTTIYWHPSPDGTLCVLHGLYYFGFMASTGEPHC